jgi:hypothetical protein
MLVRGTSGRPGLSLLEVIVSLIVLLFSLVAIGELVNFGSDRALEARYYQHAAFLCQAKLAELAIGDISLQSQSEQSFKDANSDWTWSADCANDTGVDGLWRVQVTVYRETPYGQKISVSLNKFLIDPAKRGSTFDSPPDPLVQLDPNYKPPPSSSQGSTGGTAKSGGSNTSGLSKGAGNAKFGGGPKTGGAGGPPTTGGTKTGPTMGGTPGGTGGTPGVGSKTGGTKGGKGG